MNTFDDFLTQVTDFVKHATDEVNKQTKEEENLAKAKEVLLEALKKYEGALLLVSHEKQFAEAVCNEVFTCREP